MADEIRVTDQPSTPATGMTRANPTDPDATVVAGHTGGRAMGDSGDPNTARAQIEQTRARMSETIDEIEEVLVRKKEELQDRLDFMAPVRERPLVSVGVVFGAGLLLGLITGGDDDDDRDRGYRRGRDADFDEDLEARAETWERRARRLLRIAREQEEELETHSSRRGRALPRDWDGEDEHEDGRRSSGPSRMDHMQDELTERMTGYVTGAIRTLFGTGAAHG